MVIYCNQKSLTSVVEFDFIENNTKIMKGTGSRIVKAGACTLNDIQGKLKYTLKFDVKANSKNSFNNDVFVSPILDTNNQTIGKIGFVKNSNSRMPESSYIDFYDKKINVYVKGTGEYIHLSVFHNEIQIAEILKFNYVENALDNYIIFLLDEYLEYKEIIMLFNIYFDNCFFGNQLQYREGTDIRKIYTNNKNEKYNPNWLKDNFTGAELDAILSKQIPSKASYNNSNIANWIMILFVCVIAISFILVAAIFIIAFIMNSYL